MRKESERIAKERGLMRGHIARVCGRVALFYEGAEEVRGRSGDVVVSWVEIPLPGGATMRITSPSSAKTRRRVIEVFGSMPDGALALSTKRVGMISALGGAK